MGQPDRRPPSACDSGGVGSNSILQVTRVGDVAGRGRDRAGAVDHRARRRRPARTPRRPARSAPRCSTRPACPSPDAQVSITGPDVAVAEHDRRGLRVLRVPHARRVHRDGDRRHRCRRPGSARPEPVDVGDGRPDDVDDVQLRHRGDDHDHRLVGLDGHARDEHPDRDREHRPAAVRPVHVRAPARRRSRRCSRTRPGYTVFAGNCTDNNPNGLDTTRNRFYNNPGTVDGHRHAGRRPRPRRSRSTTCRSPS